MALAESVAENRDAVAAGLLLAFEKGAALAGLDSQGLEQICGDLEGADTFGLVASAEVHVFGPGGGGDGGEGVSPLAPGREVGEGHHHFVVGGSLLVFEPQD